MLWVLLGRDDLGLGLFIFGGMYVHLAWAGWGGHIFGPFLSLAWSTGCTFFVLRFLLLYTHLWRGGTGSWGGMMWRWNWPVCPGFRC